MSTRIAEGTAPFQKVDHCTASTWFPRCPDGRGGPAGPRSPGWPSLHAGLVAAVLGCLWLLVGSAGAAELELYGAGTTGSSCSPSSNGTDRSCIVGYGVERINSTQYRSRFRWNINADTGFLGDKSMSSDAVHNLSVRAFVDEGQWYTITVDQDWVFHVGRTHDSSGFDNGGSASVSSLAGTYSGPGDTSYDTDPTHTLDIPLSTSLNTSYDLSATQKVYDQGQGQTGRIHDFSFAWDGSVRSHSSEVAVRMGAINDTTTGCELCKYPGSPSRTQADDGHFVTVTLEVLCGNGVLNTEVGEECDGGSCCDSECRIVENACGDGNACTNDSCVLSDGVSAVCAHSLVANGTSCDDGIFCNGADTCSTGTCVHAGDPCPGADGDADCSETCNESAGACTADDADGASCDDGLFCNGVDTCQSGSCATHAGDPCVGPDGDENCSESCAEATDSCTAPDADGTLCRPDSGNGCDVAETCSAGACPADGFVAAGTLCRAARHPECDVDDFCSGTDAYCTDLTLAGACEDGNPCTTGESCAGGSCTGGSDVVCDDGDLCTSETCDPNLGCVAEGITPPLDTCETGFEKTLLQVKESKPGKENLLVKLQKGPALEQLDLGDPLAPNGTAYSVCVFDDTGALAGSLAVDAAGGDCDGKPCWKSIGDAPPDGKGYLYKDKTGSADGVRLWKMKAGDAGKPLVLVNAKNNAKKGETALPLGIASSLEQTSAAVVVVMGDGGECFAGAVDQVKTQEATHFKAQGQSRCGDGEATLLEECDGADLRGDDCTDLGFVGGTLACDSSCGLDTSGCDDGVRRVFVTSGSTTGVFGGVAGGDTICQAHADAAGLGGTWTAWLSDDDTDAASRITDARYERIDGVLVADGLADLTDGTLEAAIEVTEIGGPVPSRYVWTGTRWQGTRASRTCEEWSPLGFAGHAGRTDRLDRHWTESSGDPCDERYALFCFED